MCGRFALYSSPGRIKTHFATVNELDFDSSFNIAPAQTVPVIREDETGQRIVTLARWGLIPSWVKDTDEMQQPVNAKAEDYTAWLDTKLTDIIKIQAMAQPYPERLMQAYPISRNLNNPQHDAPDLIIPMHGSGYQGSHAMYQYR
jgi:putative SOS response-associated peptidase YedK